MALTDNLLAFYKLDNTNDSSGNNRTLTNNGNVSFASGKIGNAAVFDGTNYLTSDQSIALGPNVTISGWVKAVDTAGTAKAYFGHSNGYSAFILGLVNNSATFGPNGPGGPSFDYSAFIDQWIHVAAVATGDNWVLYVNGIASAPATVDSFTVESTPSFGTMLAWMDGIYTGELDAVGIWNRALSDSEVAALYNSGTGLELPEAPAVKNGWITDTYWINDVATTLDQNGDGTWVGKLYENGSLFSGSKYSLTFVAGVAQAEQIVTVIGNNIPVAFGLNEAEEPLVELVFASITSAGETTVEQIIPTVLPSGYTVAETVLAYSIDTTATFEGTINVDFILPSNISQAVFDRVKGFHVKNSGAIEEMTRVASDFNTKKITVAISSFSDFLFMDEPPANKSVKVVGKSKFVGKIKFA